MPIWGRRLATEKVVRAKDRISEPSWPAVVEGLFSELMELNWISRYSFSSGSQVLGSSGKAAPVTFWMAFWEAL